MVSRARVLVVLNLCEPDRLSANESLKNLLGGDGSVTFPRLAQLRRIDARQSDLRAHRQIGPRIGSGGDRVAVDDGFDVGNV